MPNTSKVPKMAILTASTRPYMVVNSWVGPSTWVQYSHRPDSAMAATQVMANAFAAKGVRANAVGPGPVLPNDHEGSAGFAREVAAVPLRRAVSPDEVAAAVLYLAEARSVTGQFLAVDAGQHLAAPCP